MKKKFVYYRKLDSAYLTGSSSNKFSRVNDRRQNFTRFVQITYLVYFETEILKLKYGYIPLYKHRGLYTSSGMKWSA